MWMAKILKLEKHYRGCKRSPRRNVREQQDQIVIVCKTTSTGHYLTRCTTLCPSPGLSFSICKGVGERPHSHPVPGFNAFSLGRWPVAPSNHRSSHNGSGHPRLGSASRSSRTVPLLTTARLYLSTSTRSSSRLPSRLGPLLPASATGSSTRATLAT